jgi:hypothetical protein
MRNNNNKRKTLHWQFPPVLRKENHEQEERTEPSSYQQQIQDLQQQHEAVA